MKRLQILVPHYKESEEMLSVLLNSINSQIEIDKNDIGVVICSDGDNIKLSDKFFKRYPFDIRHVVCAHRGVSATRNSALLLSDAEYVMYCDADDCFYSIFGIKIILDTIDKHRGDELPLDVISSKFYQEDVKNGQWSLNLYDHNNIYIHGRIYRREFLIFNQIYFNENTLANEDCFYSIFGGFVSNNTVNIDVPFYCWKCNTSSLTHDPDYICKTLHYLLMSNDSVVELMSILGKKPEEIAYTAFHVICQCYLDFNKPVWHDGKHDDNKRDLLSTLKWYINKNGNRCSVLSDSDKKDILQNARSSHHYTTIESITFNDFVKMVMAYEE